MNRKILVVVIVLIIGLPVAWYLLSPIWRVVEVNEESPLTQNQAPMIDNLSKMASQTRDQYESEMKTMEGEITEMADDMPNKSIILYQGNFVSKAHDVSGNVMVIEANGKRYLRFENFETLNGPKLNIYLSADDQAKDFIDLGPIKATKGNVNYELPSNIDFKKYNRVFVWCVAFSVLFGEAIVQ